MLTLRGSLLLAGVTLALCQTPYVAAAQGKGGGKAHGGGQPQAQDPVKEKSRGQGKAKESPPPQKQKQVAEPRGRSGEVRADKGPARESSNQVKGANKAAKKEFTRAASISSLPVSMRRFISSGRPRDAIAAGAVAHAFARGHGNDFRIDESGNRVRISNRRGDALVDLDDESAQNLGRWRVGVIDDDVRDGAPSFCRSGAGHPVWGRQWCLDKGFGLGSYQDYRWGRTTDVSNIVFPRSGIGSTLATSALAGLLGSNTFNRLALHAVTLGLLEPLTGRWVSEPTGPQMLMVNSGSYPVAEMVDTNRDFRLEDLLVALLPW
jgi:hypothetical protein